MKFYRELDIYGDNTILKRFEANETNFEIVQGKISAIISESEIDELINSNVTMYSKLASAILDINSLTLNFSDLTTKYNTLLGSYEQLDSKVAEYKLSVDGLSATISSVQTDLDANYSTTSQMNAAIKASTDSISSEVSSLRTTLQNNYSTTTSMNSAINQSANGIKQTVAATYTTKNEFSSTTSRLNTLISQVEDDITLQASSISNLNGSLESLSAQVSLNSNNISLKVNRDDIITEINASPERLVLKSNRLVIESTHFSLSEEGLVNINNGYLMFSTNDDSSYLSIENGLITTNTKSNNYKGLEIFDNHIYFYAWTWKDNRVGELTSYREHKLAYYDNEYDIGIALVADTNDTLALGYYSEESREIFINAMTINRRSDGSVEFYNNVYWVGSDNNRTGCIRSYHKTNQPDILGIELYGDYLDCVSLSYTDVNGNVFSALEIDARDNNIIKCHRPINIPGKPAENVINGCKFYCGTNVYTIKTFFDGGTYIAFSNQSIRDNLNEPNANGNNTIVLACNGDNDANGWAVNGCTYIASSDTWNVFINGGTAGALARVNLFVICWA